jgi:pyruvate dehydrogenase phosphatase
MLQPVKVPSKTTTVIRHPKEPTMTATEIQANSSLASHPNQEAKVTSRPKEIKLADLSLAKGFPPRSEDVTEEETKKSQEQNGSTPTSATFGRFASRMKLMLRRKNTNAKKKQKKKKEYEDVERIEDVHWTEM